ncbi:MAG: monovalent cation:proton antiporter-2 (CPA2) family protein [Pseudomonadota bacterium]
MGLLEQIVLFLGATVILVPLCNFLKLGSVLGYLLAGIVIGPIMGVMEDVDSILHFAELGVVILLFIIGLELQPSRLWVLRRSIFGLGAAQVLITGVVLSGATYFLGIPMMPALLIGFALALSSTAFVIQTLSERDELTTSHGRAAFAILLFQDLAVIPLIAILPALAATDAGGQDTHALIAAIQVAVAGVLIIVLGRYLLRPVFRFVASSASHEVFDALALLIVLGVALIMEHVGLSMALGAFMAGMLLADSEYRHELEADLLPFKGLLLGLFFIAVGMSTNLSLLTEKPFTILGLVVGLIVIKATILFVLGRISGRSRSASSHLALDLSQGGEFAFVVFAAAVGYQLLDQALGDLLVAVVIVSMIISPILMLIDARIIRPRFVDTAKPPEDAIEPGEHRLIMVGYGRFGQIVGRLLALSGFDFTALETSPEQVKIVRQFGTKVYFGDATRPDLLRAAGAEQATAILLAVDNIEMSLKLAEQIKHHFPHLQIYARARNRKHAHLLMDLGVTHIVRDTFHSSLAMAKELLEDLGLPREEAAYRVERFRAHDEQTLVAQQAVHHDERQLIQTTREAAVELESVLQADQETDRKEDEVNAW